MKRFLSRVVNGWTGALVGALFSRVMIWWTWMGGEYGEGGEPFSSQLRVFWRFESWLLPASAAIIGICALLFRYVGVCLRSPEENQREPPPIAAP